MYGVRTTDKILRLDAVEPPVIRFTTAAFRRHALDLRVLFDALGLRDGDPGWSLRNDPRRCAGVVLRDYALTWPEERQRVPWPDGSVRELPFQLDPGTCIRHAEALEDPGDRRLGDRMRRWRREAGLTQEELARRVGTSKHYISRLENHRVEPEWRTLRKIAEIGLGRELELVLR
jgi:DNA-binding XRE family transcriptional regulator